MQTRNVSNTQSGSVRSTRSRFLHWLKAMALQIMGVAPRHLRTAPRSEVVALTAVGLYSLLWTAVSAGLVASKVGLSMGGLIGWMVALLCFFPAWGLLLMAEVMLINTVKPGTTSRAAVLRLGLSLLVVGTQTLATLTVVQHDQIRAYQAQQVLAKVNAQRTASEEAYGLEKANKATAEAARAAEAAQRALDQKEDNAAVREAKQALSKAEGDFRAADDAKGKADKRVRAAQALSIMNTDPQKRGDLERAVEIAKAQATAAQSRYQKADEAVESARGALTTAELAWKLELENRATAAKAKVELADKAVSDTRKAVADDVGKSRKVEEAAAASSLMGDMVAYIKLMWDQPLTYGLTGVLVLLAVTIMDMLPFGVRMAYRDASVYAVQQHAEELNRIDLEIARIEAKMRLAGAQQNADMDAGATHAQQLAAEAEFEALSAYLARSTRHVEVQLAAIGGALEKALDLQQRVAALNNPTLAQMVQNLVRDLSTRLEAVGRRPAASAG